MSIRLRSALFTPATHPERFAKAEEVDADILIIDLEDAIAPKDKKSARATAFTTLNAAKETRFPCIIRINGLDTSAGLCDVLELLASPVQPEFLLLPKTESAAHLQIVDRLLSEKGLSTKLIGLIESAVGLKAVSDIAHATPRLAALMFGAADLAADLGCGPFAANLTFARVSLVSACATAAIAAIDSPFFDIRDLAGLERAALQAADMGFAGKAAIHPSQIAAINQAFTPTADEIVAARAILIENCRGVGQVNGVMVDEAVARQARRVLVRAGQSTEV
ncbi:itaconate degradation C-C-lyase RipC [Pseudomonas fluorescens]|uniref:itaconate degradation C-C-lyase RipC n=1 Tax=Pseudomonas fluorescens TaxID=294 RepID=UPI001249A753|nr:itaconate degradation C-C-lyase RipC [Pseudomonas fluorescens]CAG8866473.1 L-malyl-CoA/beta-methylmalyl-CoA lyase [Pseudomonas fluorescens]